MVRRHEHVVVDIEVAMSDGTGVLLDQQGVRHAVLVLVQRRSLIEPSLHNAGVLFGTGHELAAPLEQLEDLVEVPRRHRSHERDLVCESVDEAERTVSVLTAVLGDVAPDLPDPLCHPRAHGPLDTLAVATEFIDHDRWDEQLQSLVEDKQSDRHDPFLAVAAPSEVEPHRGVDQESQHVATLRRWSVVVAVVLRHLSDRYSLRCSIQSCVPISVPTSKPAPSSRKPSRAIGSSKADCGTLGSPVRDSLE
jgi:hypothetical protein